MYNCNNYTYKYYCIYYGNCSGIHLCIMYSISYCNLPYIVQRIFPRTQPYKYLCKSTNNYCCRRCSVAFEISIYSRFNLSNCKNNLSRYVLIIA